MEYKSRLTGLRALTWYLNTHFHSIALEMNARLVEVTLLYSCHGFSACLPPPHLLYTTDIFGLLSRLYAEQQSNATVLSRAENPGKSERDCEEDTAWLLNDHPGQGRNRRGASLVEPTGRLEGSAGNCPSFLCAMPK